MLRGCHLILSAYTGYCPVFTNYYMVWLVDIRTLIRKKNIDHKKCKVCKPHSKAQVNLQ